jgi:hypothetical protein
MPASVSLLVGEATESAGAPAVCWAFDSAMSTFAIVKNDGL